MTLAAERMAMLLATLKMINAPIPRIAQRNGHWWCQGGGVLQVGGSATGAWTVWASSYIAKRRQNAGVNWSERGAK
jgi:hypothetical protein